VHYVCDAILQALESLSVADNHLQHLPASMAGLISLKQLWAYGNHLQSLPADILDLPAIICELTAICLLKSFCPACFALCHTCFAFCSLASPYLHSILTLSYQVDLMHGKQLHSSSCLAPNLRYQQCADYHVFHAIISASAPQLLHCKCIMCVLHFAMAFFNIPFPAVCLLRFSVRPVLWLCQCMQMLLLDALFLVSCICPQPCALAACLALLAQIKPAITAQHMLNQCTCFVRGRCDHGWLMSGQLCDLTCVTILQTCG
jgi:hypothetical protein